MSQACPECGTRLPGHGPAPCLPLGRALALIGGLALVAAYFMPWLGLSSPQGSVVLTGEFLGRFLAGTSDLSRFLPGSGDPSEARLLRALVYLFPASGALAAIVALLAAFRPGLRSPANVLLALLGAGPLLALIIGLSRLPPGASQEVGLRLIGAGALAILLGVGLDAALGAKRVLWGQPDGSHYGAPPNLTSHRGPIGARHSRSGQTELHPDRLLQREHISARQDTDTVHEALLGDCPDLVRHGLGRPAADVHQGFRRIHAGDARR